MEKEDDPLSHRLSGDPGSGYPVWTKKRGLRTGKDDRYPEADIVIGPIANDTLYDTFGVFTSGLLEKNRVLQLLLAGPSYEQIVIKTDRARGQLCWIESEKLSADMVSEYRKIVKQEESAYQEAIARILDTPSH